MRSYIPNTQEERRAMLASIGLGSMDDLFTDIPEEARLGRPLNLPKGLSEQQVRKAFAAYKPEAAALPLFRGAGAYRHYIPAVVDAVASRSEFYTAYTPYQPEMSQGLLQAIFEYQTLICELTGLDAANASVYDGGTACAEVLGMFRGITRKNRVLYSAGLHPEYVQVLKTYARFSGYELVEIPLGPDGRTDIAAFKENLLGAAGLLLQSPNFLGVVEDTAAFASAAHQEKALLAAIVNPISLGILKRPGDLGADICVGEGQPLGIPLSAGGPYLGFMAAKAAYLRHLPGRIAGQTQDAEGNRAFVLTLQAREQHIRREKAQSNICSNESLCALRAAVYLGAMGPQGMRETAGLCLQHAHYLKDGILQIPGMRLRYDAPFFHEFVIDSAADSAVLDGRLRKSGFIGGLPLSRYFPGDNGILYCATECNSREEIDAFLNTLEEAVK